MGLWDPDSDLTKPRQRLEAAGAGHLAVTFAECVATLDAMAAALNSAPGHPQGPSGAAKAESSTSPTTPATRRSALLHS